MAWKGVMMKGWLLLQFEIYFLLTRAVLGQNYEVADIDCAIGTGGKELLTARLRRPDGFRGTPIFADDRGQSAKEPTLPIIPQDLNEDLPCQIYADPLDNSGRVFKLRITDFSQCGVMKRNGFIHVRVWFPQLPGVVMLSDQEVIIMCKPPAATVVQSKTAGFAGSIPSGARISGIVEESPGRLEYEVALYRETATPASLAGRSTSSYVTGQDSHELPVDQAVPIGTRLQLRAKINPDSAWKHAKLMEVSVSPDPKNPNADGSVALVRDGCRNPDLASIIPKQPYRYKERTNEVVLDFEAFLLSNMADRSTLWLHTQIKACMESQDCHPDFCMDVYQPSGFGRRRKRSVGFGPGSEASTSMGISKNNATTMDYSAPLSQHWTAYADEIILDNDNDDREEEEGETSRNASTIETLNDLLNSLGAGASRFRDKIPAETVVKSKPGIATKLPTTTTRRSTTLTSTTTTTMSTTVRTFPKEDDNSSSTKFGDNIGFSVIMPSDYYRTGSGSVLSPSYECRGWATATLASLLAAGIAVLLACGMSYRLKRAGKSKEKSLYPMQSQVNMVRSPGKVEIPMILGGNQQGQGLIKDSGQRNKYARDPSIYRS